jgi:prepilin-type N-terminal cleavage/methylation domain-containing protein
MKTKNSGFTLAEVLVSIVIGVISIAAAFASYNYFNKSYKSVSQKAAINSLLEMH